MALSLDLRERIINAYDNKEGSVRKLAQRFSVSPTTVCSLLQHYKKEGHFEPVSPPGRTPEIDQQGLKMIQDWLNEKNDLTLRELRDAYADKTGRFFSLMTLQRCCKKLKLAYKKNKTSR